NQVGAFAVLQRRRSNFAGRRRATVSHDYQWNLRHSLAGLGLKLLARELLALEIGDFAALHEQVGQLDAVFRRAYRTVTQIQNQLLRALLLQVGDVDRDLLHLAGGQRLRAEVADSILQHLLFD